MNTRAKIEQLEGEIADRQKAIKWLESHEERLAQLPEAVFFPGERYCLDFDNLPHADVVQVIKALPAGKWDKQPNSNPAKVDYTATVDGVVVRCYAGEPPPNCRIVEEEVEIPAQPARKEIRRRLECKPPLEEAA
jgi:hypothetical protein